MYHHSFLSYGRVRQYMVIRWFLYSFWFHIVTVLKLNFLGPGDTYIRLWTEWLVQIVICGPFRVKLNLNIPRRILGWALRSEFMWNSIKIQIYHLKEMFLKMSSAKCQPCCPGLSVFSVHGHRAYTRHPTMEPQVTPARASFLHAHTLR